MIKAKLIGGALDGFEFSISRLRRHIDAYFRLETDEVEGNFVDSCLLRYRLYTTRLNGSGRLAFYRIDAVETPADDLTTILKAIEG